MKSDGLRGVPSSKFLVEEAKRLGAKWKYHGGEVMLQDPRGGKWLRVNCRRKDAPRRLIQFIQQMSN